MYDLARFIYFERKINWAYNSISFIQIKNTFPLFFPPKEKLITQM